MEPEDVDPLLKWENNSDNWEVSNTLVPFSKHTIELFVNSVQDIYANKQLRFMICLNNGEVIGCVDLFDLDPKHQRVGVGILIAEKPERGKGYAKEALEKIIDYSKNTLNLHQVYCNILSENTTSIGLFKSFGFEKIGSKKDWINSSGIYKDEEMYQLIM